VIGDFAAKFKSRNGFPERPRLSGNSRSIWAALLRHPQFVVA
jgi:hypothetical protein